MDTIPIELYEIIFGFLSVKEKITIREVSLLFESRIKRINLLVNRVENILKKSHFYRIQKSSALLLTVHNSFIMYTDYRQNGIHSLFKVNNHSYNKCIDSCCREKRLGNIYFSKKSSPDHNTASLFERPMNYYSKRNIPYCMNCYNNWD